MSHVHDLLAIASEALGPEISCQNFGSEFALGAELFNLLRQKNGFYGFEQALHVFPSGADTTGTMTLEHWNTQTLWRSAFGDLAEGLLFFAEDALGDQFCLSKREPFIFRFYSETGELTRLADSIEDWAGMILSDYEFETGWPLAHKWQAQHGPLPLGQRLQPKISFIYGGAYELDNLWVGDAVKGMLFKADIAKKVKDLPEGTQVKLVVQD